MGIQTLKSCSRIIKLSAANFTAYFVETAYVVQFSESRMGYAHKPKNIGNAILCKALHKRRDFLLEFPAAKTQTALLFCCLGHFLGGLLWCHGA